MKYLLSIILIITTNCLIGQEENLEFSKNHFTISYGRSAPQGAFAETDPEEEPGFAVNGTVFTLGYQHFYKKNVAVTFRYGRSRNGFASSSYSSLLDNFDNNDTINWFTEAEDYRVNFGLLGLKLVNGEKTRLYINPMVGLGSFTAPEVKISARTISGLFVNQRIRESDIAYELMFGVAGGLDIFLTEGINLNFDLFYLVSEFRYTAILDTFNSAGQPIQVQESGEQPYSTVNISIGLDFRF